MTSIGETLRSAREAQGRSLADSAAELCITQRYLCAIEDDDVASLPGTFFFMSFARQYASILGLDRAQVEAALASMAEIAVKPVEASAPILSSGPIQFPRFQFSPVSSRDDSPVRSLDPIVEDTNRRYFSRPMGLSWAGLVVAIVLGSGIFAWWTRPPQTVQMSPSKVALPIPSAAATPVSLSESLTPAAQSSSIQGSSPDVVATAVSDVSTAPVAETPALQASAIVDDGKQVTLNLSATERTWLSITSHGKVIFSGILEPSQSKTLQGSEVATMKIGNAGGVDVQWNGKSIGPIGARGQVRTVRFTREDFQILEPESPDQL